MRITRRIALALTATATMLSTVNLASAQALEMPRLNLSSFLGSANPLDNLGRPTAQTQQRARDFANQPWVPKDARDAILSAVAFYGGSGNGGGDVKLVDGGPHFTQFYWPTVSGSCIGGAGDSVGSAIAVPGPTEIPAPGAAEGETVFLFTALGTTPAAAEQGKMHIQWFNLNTFTSGITALTNNGINPDGPATISGTARTGKGTIVAVLSGTVNTKDQPCRFIPTAAIFEVK
ncbi:MAG: hypothetical protein SOW59_07100 [Corynebacterium sp.]|nr:hypothetical protein [Corynebacterium sp.]